MKKSKRSVRNWQVYLLILIAGIASLALSTFVSGALSAIAFIFGLILIAAAAFGLNRFIY
jgi:hypothetical protein